jgi:CBS domain containing-hemolysin-like protein
MSLYLTWVLIGCCIIFSGVFSGLTLGFFGVQNIKKIITGKDILGRLSRGIVKREGIK